MATLRASSSGGVPTENDSSPSPSLPIILWPDSLPVAAHTGGCGSWIGLGSTRRLGIDQYLPLNSYSSFVQQPTMCSSPSCHMGRVSSGWMPKPSISMRVDDRPVPNSTRPLLMRSSTAADSADRTGWLYG